MKPESHPPSTPKPPAGPSSPKPPAGPKHAVFGSTEEVAEYLRVPVDTLYVWRNRHKGPRAARVGRHLRYRWTDVDKWLDQQAAPESAAAEYIARQLRTRRAAA